MPITAAEQNLDHIDRKYRAQVIKPYAFWTLMLSENQNYLGRMVVWLRRAGTFQRFSQLSDSEVIELRRICGEAEAALHELWSPDHINYGWLGNLFKQHGGHGHMHVIPRYARSRMYRSHRFEDKRWGQNYAPCDAYLADQSMLAAMRDDIRKAIG